MEGKWIEEYKKMKEREERFNTGGLSLNDPVIWIQEERAKQKTRMERFQMGEKEVEYWEKYQDPSGEIKKDSLYVYGADYLSTKGIMQYFHYFSPVKVEWLNDTSCNVIFPCEDNAAQALNTCCLEKVDPDNFENIKRTAVGYQNEEEVIPIFMRFSTTGDVKKEDVKAKNSKYYKWRNNIKNKAIGRRK